MFVSINEAETYNSTGNLIATDSNLLPRSLFNQWKYREQYERAKDKFTSVLETPEYETHKRSKNISDVSFWACFFFFHQSSFLDGKKIHHVTFNCCSLHPS